MSKGSSTTYEERIEGMVDQIDDFLESSEYLDYSATLAVTCPTCYMPLPNKSEFLQHINLHYLFAEPVTTKVKALHCCFPCGLAFFTPREYRSHHDACHPFHPLPLPGANLVKTKKS